MKRNAILFLCLLISGCSTFSFVFERLDVLTIWQMNRMFDLTDEQEEQFEPVAVELREWIREEGFPRLIIDFKEVDRLWNDNQLERAMSHMHETTKGNIELLLKSVWPKVRPTILTFNENNLAHYKEHTKEQRDDWFKSATSKEAKLESRIKPLEEWFGDLSDAQVVIVDSWIELAPKEREIRYANNDHWITMFTQRVLARDQDSLDTWSQEPSMWWTEEFRQWRNVNEVATKSMLMELFNTLSEQQKRHASERLREWIELMEEVVVS